MDPIAWTSSTCSHICGLFAKSSRTISRGFRKTRDWLLTPLRTEERIYFVTKLIAIALGTAFVWYFGWKGLQLAQNGLQATLQSNKLSAKQICLSGNLTVGEQLWCDDFNHNVPLAAIADVREWIAVSASSTKNWLNTKLTTLSLCSTYSAVEGKGDTCLGVGIVLVLFLLTHSSTVDKSFRLGQLGDYLSPVLALVTHQLGDTYFDIAVTFVHVFLCVVVVGVSIAETMQQHVKERCSGEPSQAHLVLISGLLASLLMYSTIWIAKCLWYNTGECLFYFAVVVAAILKATMDAKRE